jgi:hypothetical protein
MYSTMAMQCRLFPSKYPLTHDAVWLLESSPPLEGNYFNNRFLYYFNINYSPLDYDIPTSYLMMTIQSRLLTSWYPLTPDAVGLLESSLLEGNYINNWFLYCFNINYSPFDFYIPTLFLMMTMQSRVFCFLKPLWPVMPLECWDLILSWKAIILKIGSYIILISITLR